MFTPQQIDDMKILSGKQFRTFFSCLMPQATAVTEPKKPSHLLCKFTRRVTYECGCFVTFDGWKESPEYICTCVDHSSEETRIAAIQSIKNITHNERL